MPWRSLRPGLSAVVSILLVGATTVIMMVSGMEVELRTSAWTSTVRWWPRASPTSPPAWRAACWLARPSAPRSSRTGWAALGAAWASIAGLVCVAVLVTGTGLLNDIPKFAIGALLVCTGAERLIERIWLERGRMPLHERAAVLVVLVAVIWYGYVEGVVVGLADHAGHFRLELPAHSGGAGDGDGGDASQQCGAPACRAGGTGARGRAPSGYAGCKATCSS